MFCPKSTRQRLGLELSHSVVNVVLVLNAARQSVDVPGPGRRVEQMYILELREAGGVGEEVRGDGPGENELLRNCGEVDGEQSPAQTTASCIGSRTGSTDPGSSILG